MRESHAGAWSIRERDRRRLHASRHMSSSPDEMFFLRHEVRDA